MATKYQNPEKFIANKGDGMWSVDDDGNDITKKPAKKFTKAAEKKPTAPAKKK